MTKVNDNAILAVKRSIVYTGIRGSLKGGEVIVKGERIGREIRLPLNKTKESRPVEILLATLCMFSRQGRNEVSLSEIQESIAEYQRKSPELGYTYSTKFLYSLDVLADLARLNRDGYVRQYNYRHDSFLPKRYLALTPLGKGRGCKILEKLPGEDAENVSSSVAKAIENHKLRWRLWSR